MVIAQVVPVAMIASTIVMEAKIIGKKQLQLVGKKGTMHLPDSVNVPLLMWKFDAYRVTQPSNVC